MTRTGITPNPIVEKASAGGLVMKLSGDYREAGEAPSIQGVREALDKNPGSKSLSFESASLTGWDSRLVVFVRNCEELCRARNVVFRGEGLPEGMRRLLRLAQAVPEQKDAQRATAKIPFFQLVGEGALKG